LGCFLKPRPLGVVDYFDPLWFDRRDNFIGRSCVIVPAAPTVTNLPNVRAAWAD
jgi:hypothetical protein